MTYDIISPLGSLPRAASGVPPVPGGKAMGVDRGQEIEGSDKSEQPAETLRLPGSPAADNPSSPTQDAQQAVDNLRELVQAVRRNLEFSVDSESGREVIKVIDPETDKVIRQIPPEDVLRISRHLTESLGALIRAEA
jgi:flagellar protein FlaG